MYDGFNWSDAARVREPACEAFKLVQQMELRSADSEKIKLISLIFFPFELA